ILYKQIISHPHKFNNTFLRFTSGNQPLFRQQLPTWFYEYPDFFDDKTRSTVLNGKSFDPTNDYDTARHYGKHVFSQRVVLANASTIDFGGFRQLLTNLSKAIEIFGKA